MNLIKLIGGLIMIYNNYKEGEVPGIIEVDIICSKCKTINTVAIDRVSKLNLCCCPACGNIDIERMGTKMSANVIKQLKEKAEQSDSYTVEGKPINDFLLDLEVNSMMMK